MGQNNWVTTTIRCSRHRRECPPICVRVERGVPGPLRRRDSGRAKRSGLAGSCCPTVRAGCLCSSAAPTANACLTCPLFITTPDFLPQHHEHLAAPRRLIATAEADGQFRLVKMSQQVANNLERVITSQQADRPEESAVRADNTRYLTLAAQCCRERTLQKATDRPKRAEQEGTALTVGGLAAQVGVTRSWIYTQPELLARLHDLAGRHTSDTTPPPPQRASDASLHRRLELAHQRNQHLEGQVRELRRQPLCVLGERRLAQQHGDAAALGTGLQAVETADRPDYATTSGRATP